MANEILYSGLGDLRVREVLAQEILLLLADRSRLGNHPALFYVGDATGSGTATIQAAALGWAGYDILSAVAEGASVSNTALTDASYTVTVARRAKQYTASDLARITDSFGMLSDPGMFAMDAVQSADSTLVNLIAALPSNFVNSVGSTGVNMTVANFFSAIAQLETQNVTGPYLSLLHPVQFGDFKDSLRSETGPLQLVPASADLMAVRGPGFKGSFLGVDIFTSTQVPTANSGADRAGGMWGRGAVLWADASIPNDGDAPGRIYAGKVMIDFDRDASSATKKIVTNYYLGVAEGIDAAGVGIVTDA